MPEHADRLLPPVLAAMSALDDAAGEHDRLVEQLHHAMLDGVRLDEQLRAVPFQDTARLEAAAQSYGAAVNAVQRLSVREKESRDVLLRAQAALTVARKEQSHARSEMLRIELEIDAASIWDLVGRFEQEVRSRLEEHAKIAADMRFAAAAAGEKSSMALEASTLAPALGTAGPALWTALAGGVQKLYDETGALPRLTAPPADDAAPRSPDATTQAEALAPVVLPRMTAASSSVELSAALLQGLPFAVPTPPPGVLARAVTIPAAVARPAVPIPTAVARPDVPIPTAVAPPAAPTPSLEHDSPFDFGRRPATNGKGDPALTAFVARAAPASDAPSLPLREKNRGRLDKMLRNLAGMVGTRRDPQTPRPRAK